MEKEKSEMEGCLQQMEGCAKVSGQLGCLLIILSVIVVALISLLFV